MQLLLLVVRKNHKIAVAASCLMVSKSESDYVDIFSYLESYFGKINFDIVKYDMKHAVINSVNKKMKFE